MLCEQVPPELTKDQVMKAKKVELQTCAERGVFEVVDQGEVKLNPESVMPSVTWVITNMGSVECSKPKARLVAREFVSDAIDRDTVFSGTPSISRVAIQRSSRKKLKKPPLDVTTAFLYGRDSQGGPRTGKSSFGSTSCRVSVGDTRRAPALGQADLGYYETKGAARVLWNPISRVEVVLHGGRRGAAHRGLVSHIEGHL